METSKKFLAFDLGASNGRVIAGIFQGKELILDEIHRFPNEYVEVRGNIYWDVLRLFFEIKKGLSLFTKKYGADLDGIGIDTWGMDFALFDKNGNLIGNPHHYRDRRTEGIVEEISSLIDEYRIYEATGSQLSSISTISQLYSMVKNNSPQLKIANFFLMMPGTFNYFLTGEKIEEYTAMTPTCLYNIREDAPAISLFEKLNIPTKIVPTIIKPGTIIGDLLSKIREEVGLGKVPVIAPASHDSASAAVAVPANGSENWAYLSAGTWFNFGIETPTPIINRKSYEFNIDNMGAAFGKFIARIAITGLWVIQKCKESWDKQGEVLDYKQMTRLAESAKPPATLIDVEDEIFINPPDMPKAIIQYCKKADKKISKDKGAIVRIVLESLAVKCKEIVEKIESLKKEPIETLYVVGGGAQNKFLNQLIANVTRKTVVAGPVEATAVGNIVVQAIGTGYINSISEARGIIRSSFEIQEYYPGS